MQRVRWAKTLEDSIVQGKVRVVRTESELAEAMRRPEPFLTRREST